MDDAQCIQLMNSTRHLISETTMRWYQGDKEVIGRLRRSMPGTAPYYHGKYLSDFCRLVQLYRFGGIYLDTDLQVQPHPHDTLTLTIILTPTLFPILNTHL